MTWSLATAADAAGINLKIPFHRCALLPSASQWHTDGLYEQDTPSVATSMYSISVKDWGGDTQFMSGVQIYNDLPAFLKAAADDVIVSPAA